MEIKTIKSKKKTNPLTETFMRGSVKAGKKSKKPVSLLGMTREEFKKRLDQHKVNDGELIH